MTDLFCNQCGHQNPPDANFCSSCGAVLEAKSAEDTTISFALPDAPENLEEELSLTLDQEVSSELGILVVKRGPNAGSKFVLESEVTHVGRHPDSEIFLDDITVSRRHAEFVRQGHSYLVRDVGSLNGTYLNRERIEEAVLTNGDEVQIGKFKLVFLAGAEG